MKFLKTLENISNEPFSIDLSKVKDFFIELEDDGNQVEISNNYESYKNFKIKSDVYVLNIDLTYKDSLTIEEFMDTFDRIISVSDHLEDNDIFLQKISLYKYYTHASREWDWSTPRQLSGAIRNERASLITIYHRDIENCIDQLKYHLDHISKQPESHKYIIGIDLRFEKLLGVRTDEAWSEPYTLDFQDMGFDLEEIGQKLKGKYRGKFVMTDLNTWYSELVDRLNYEWEVTQSKHSFNKASGKASFEIEIMDKEGDNYFTILKDGEEVKLYPVSISYINYFSYANMNVSFTLGIDCKLESGSKKLFDITYKTPYVLGSPQNKFDNNSGYNFNFHTIRFTLGNKYRGIDFQKSELGKFMNIVNDLKFSGGLEIDNIHKSNLKNIFNGKEGYNQSLSEVLDKKGEWNRQYGSYEVSKKI